MRFLSRDRCADSRRPTRGQTSFLSPSRIFSCFSMLQGNRGPELMIRICLRGPVPAVNGVYDRHGCDIDLNCPAPLVLETADEVESGGANSFHQQHVLPKSSCHLLANPEDEAVSHGFSRP